MAFVSKLGNILKQSNARGSLSRPSLFQAIRCMSSSKLFIGGMEYGMNEDSLREAFSKYGEVVESKVILDRETGRSRGFGFVTFTSTEAASSAIQALDGQNNVYELPGSAASAGAVGGYNGSGGYGEGSSAGAVGGYAGSGGYGSGNAYGSNNGGFAGDNQFGGNPVGNSSQFGVGGEAQIGNMEKPETMEYREEAQIGNMEKPETLEYRQEGVFEDDTDVAKRA
ncbi:Glycine-rich RNA-binding protein 3 [Raphanus sativus]|nr:Glycine-rich RNA-binding protein 3 [Raphanus sativus]KAJ4900342.1 Glycine-rich RNA-binding protein 3 [Raphanus sativus]